MRGPKSAEHTAKLRAVLTSARTSRLKADQKARERFLGGSVQFGYRTGSWCRTSSSKRLFGKCFP
jgi:hypothetical protein